VLEAAAGPPPGTARAPVDLPIRGGPFTRASVGLVAGLRDAGTATVSATLKHLGVTRVFVDGPRPLTPGHSIVGSAVTLQFMPQREDIASGVAQEYVERTTALWAVLETIEPGDVLVIAANASSHTGCLGEMLVRYIQKRGGVGVVVDGRIRDSERVAETGLPIWSTGVTPNFASQSELFPWAYDVPVAVGGVLCLPGDVVMADADGVVVVPRQLAADVAAEANAHVDREIFSRMKIDGGARLSDYYPLAANSQAEYEEWLSEQH
jgi:regulator of RNase E activity RraA